MPNCTTFESIAERIAPDTRLLWDYFAYPHDLVLENGRLRVPFQETAVLKSLTPHAERQLTDFFRISHARFRDADPDERDELFGEAVGKLVFPSYRALALRGRSDEIRGLVDELCAPLYNYDLIRHLWHWRRRFQVQWFSVEERAMHLRLIEPDTARQISFDDYLIAGVHIANSEVGFRHLTVEPLVFRLTTGSGIVGFGTKESTLSCFPKWDMGDLSLVLTNAVEAALHSATLALGEIAESRGQWVESPQSLLHQLTSKSPLPLAFADRALRLLEGEAKEHRQTLYGVMSAMSQAAKRYSPERRLRVEALAGRVAPRYLA